MARLELRPYQAEAVAAVYQYLRDHDDNPCVVIPTAGGKTPVMATICRDAVERWDGRVMILAHVRELLAQAAEKMRAIAPDVATGIYSAGMKSRDTDRPVTIAGIQSVYQRAEEFGPVDLVLVDEAHLIPPDGEGMYRTFLADMEKINPAVRVIGLTATPYRTTSGMICGPDNILNAVCFEVGVRDLIEQGYICRLRSKGAKIKPDTSGLHTRAGEFIPTEVEELFDTDSLVYYATSEIADLTADRNACLIFSAGVRHAEHVVQIFRDRHGIECGIVTGDTLPFERDETLRRFRDGDLKYLVNVNVLTTGFDATRIDCVALLRATLSPGLFYQMVGRGFRLHPGKTDCLVLDFGGNVLRHGPVDAIAPKKKAGRSGESEPWKECPQCHEIIHAARRSCDCGYEYPAPEPKHNAYADDTPIVSEPVEYDVQEIYYTVHTKRGAPPEHPRTMRVEYQVGFQSYVSEWICIEHTGFARQKAEAWWRARSDEPVPDTADEAVQLAEAGALTPAVRITVTKDGKYDRVTKYVLGERAEAGRPFTDDEVPF